MAQIINTTLNDLDEIFQFFDDSINYQERNGVPVWKNYDKGAIIKDINEKKQFKLAVGASTGIVFSVAYSDKVIWRDLDQGESIYLHRIVVNPRLKGQKLFGNILEWSIDHCKVQGLKTIRMDTWAINARIIDYYKSFGFQVVENYTTPDTVELPVHNRNLALTLLQFDVKS